VRLLGSSAVLTLAWFLAASIVGSAAAWIATACLRRRAGVDSTAPSATVLLGVRLLPVTLGIFVSVGMFLPVHWNNEPRDGSEPFGLLLPGMALASLLLIGRRLVPVVRALRATQRLGRAWTPHRGRHSGRIVEDPQMPGVSLAGIFRTTVVVGRPVRDALTSEELDVAIAHELAHQRARDNLKRFAMLASPDLFGCSAAARWLERQWSTEVECRADAHAAAGDPTRAANLASALLKVARLGGAAGEGSGRVSPLWSTFHHRSVLELRVRRLVSGNRVPLPLPDWGPVPWVALGAAVAAVWTLRLPHMLQVFSEVLVQSLP
jgi:Zn-dependent protease with chaperone function